MSEINFLVTNRFGDYPENTKNTIILTWDDWNDYLYYTLFGINYVNSIGEECEIGAVRIAYKGQKKGPDAKKIKIGDVFEKLDETYFSLGTEDSYYENLNSLSEEVKYFVLTGLNDLALDTQKLNTVINEEVTVDSLLRDISYSTVINQFRRIANGGARLSNYSFTYSLTNTNNSKIEFNIIAEENPPTNIQIIIGSNGVGKSFLLNNMINSVLNPENNQENGLFTFNTQYESDKFSNLICVNLLPTKFSVLYAVSIALRVVVPTQ